MMIETNVTWGNIHKIILLHADWTLELQEFSDQTLQASLHPFLLINVYLLFRFS